MTGKKVFTGAGEYLASFLTTLKNEETQTKNLNDTIAAINGTSNANNSTGVSQYQNTKSYTREELIDYVKTQFRKELSFYKTTNSGKELSIQETSQILYNTLKWVETETNSRFEALAELTFDNIAYIFKTIGENKRSYLRKIKDLTQSIAAIPTMSLDDFKGDVSDRDRVFYKFDGAILKVNNGAGTNFKFYELFKAKTKDYIANQAWVSDEIIVGGTETDSPFKTVRFMKNIYSEGDIAVADGKELKGTALKARYADLAENYTSNYDYRPGTLLQIDTKNQNEVTIYDPSNCPDQECIGIVSDKPGFVLNEDMKSDFPIVTIVLTGRSPVRVVGIVNKGDYIYPSRNLPGVAVAINPKESKNYEAENPLVFKRLGVALESTQPIDLTIGNFIPTESLITIKVN